MRSGRALGRRRSIRLLAASLVIALFAPIGRDGHGNGADGRGLPDRRFAGKALSAAYPPPVPSATPDAAGYLAPPRDIPWRIVRWRELPRDGLLAALRDELAAGASSAMSARIASRFDLGLTPAGLADSEAGLGLTRSTAEALLDAMFGAGAAPLLQGFFEGLPADGPPCLIVVSQPWPRGVPHPPLPTPPSPPSGEGNAAPVPELIEPDAAAFHFCADGLGEWLWMDWRHGRYERLLRQWGGEGPSGNATYRVLRP